MIDQRPIKPDQKYLEEYIKKLSTVQTKPYLKKKKEALLPCQQHQLQNHAEIQNQRKVAKTKAQIYDQIKLKNKLKFGQKKFQEPQKINKKKIDPKKMAVNYKPKKQIKIQTQQYKKKGKAAQKEQAQVKVNPKVEYEKLLDYYKQELSAFQKQKDQFNKIAAKLKFKEMISKQQGLHFAKIKENVQKNLINQHLSEHFNQDNVKTYNQGQLSSRKVQSKSKNQHCSKVKAAQNVKKSMSKTYSVGQIRSYVKQTTAEMKNLKDKLLHREINVKENRYDVSQINLLPTFSPQTLFQYITPTALDYNCNEFYRKAISAFHSKFRKQSQETKGRITEEMNVIHQCEQQSAETEIKVKFVGEKRVMKYHGWTEVWMPGRQRLMSDGGSGYKVVWLFNGDVLQQFANQISTYYSSAKRINKIFYNNLSPIFFSKQTGQLWWFLQGHRRQIVFENGRQEIIEETI